MTKEILADATNARSITKMKRLTHVCSMWKKTEMACTRRRRNMCPKTASVSVVKTDQLMLYREIIAVCSEIHAKHVNTPWVYNAKTCGTVRTAISYCIKSQFFLNLFCYDFKSGCNKSFTSDRTQ